jgi:opacity protein-like surface antigen
MKRTSRILIALCLPLLLCSPVRAQHTGLYAGAYLGVSALTTAKSSDSQGSFNLTYNPGLMGTAVLGWDLVPGSPVGEGRVELEYSHRSNRLDKAGFKEGKAPADGSMTVDSLLLNTFGVFRSTSPWTPYAGVGIGAARAAADDLKVTGQLLSSATAVAFAYQAGVGVDYQLTKTLWLDLGYRFFGLAPPKLAESNGQKFKTDYFSHNVILGLRLGF